MALTLAACADQAADVSAPPGSDVETVSAGGTDLSTVLAVNARRTPDLMAIEGVVGTGVAVDGESPRIRVYTVHGNVRGIPDHVDNIRVERVVTGLIVAGAARYSMNPNNPASRERPAPNGFSIGHPDITAGTLGAVVRDGDDICYALSNNHVLADINNASIGDNALQPGAFDGGQDPADAIGTLADYEPINFSGNNTIDAAVAELSDAALVTASTPGYAYGAPGSSPVSATLGMDVQKFGRTTGHTTGDVSEIGVTVNVCYIPSGPFGCAASARFVNQIGITPGTFSGGGDSGSLIVTDDANRSPVGLLYAGSSSRTLANPIQPVLSRFAVGIETNTANCANGGEPPANLPPEADFSFSTNDLQASFTDESSDPDGSVVQWSWDFGDGNGSTSQNPSHTYSGADDYLVSLTVTDDDGAQNTTSQTVSVDDGGPGGGIALSASGYKVKGRHTIDLSWSGAAGGSVDIYRNGGPLTTTANDGAYTDATGNRGKGSYTYQVCEAGSSTCSADATVTF